MRFQLRTTDGQNWPSSSAMPVQQASSNWFVIQKFFLIHGLHSIAMVGLHRIAMVGLHRIAMLGSPCFV